MRHRGIQQSDSTSLLRKCFANKRNCRPICLPTLYDFIPLNCILDFKGNMPLKPPIISSLGDNIAGKMRGATRVISAATHKPRWRHLKHWHHGIATPE